LASGLSFGCPKTQIIHNVSDIGSLSSLVKRMERKPFSRAQQTTLFSVSVCFFLFLAETWKIYWNCYARGTHQILRDFLINCQPSY